MVEADPHRHSGLREGTTEVALPEADRCLVDPDNPCSGSFDPRFLGAILAQQSLGSGSKPPIRIGNQFINARATNLADYAAR